MSVFVDTAALYALLVRTEESHVPVSRAFSALLDEQRMLVTSNYVTLETVALLQRRIGLRAVRDLAERIQPVLECRWISESVHRRGHERLVRTDRRELSLVDCTNFILMEDEGLTDVLTSDRDFAAEGFRLLPL